MSVFSHSIKSVPCEGIDRGPGDPSHLDGSARIVYDPVFLKLIRRDRQAALEPTMRHVILMLIGLAVPALAPAATLNVPSQYATIQDGIDAALGGDTVLVAPGNYRESIDFSGKAIAVRSSGGACVTTIDALISGGSVVTFASGEGPDSLLEGFTVTNGYGTYMGLGLSLGGGIYCTGASPTISGNAIIGNHAGLGGGVYCAGGSPMIINNMVADNDSYLVGGGGLELIGGFPQIINCTIMRNTSASYGPGLLCLRSACTVTNTVFWDNDTSLGTQIGLMYYLSGPSVLTISHSDVEGGLGAVYVESGSVLNWGAGMLDADPAFDDPANDDYHLTFVSPCRNTGDNLAIGLPSLDFEGDPRISDVTVDMGADEFHPHLYQTGDATPGGTIQAKFVGNPGTTQVALVLGLALLDPPLSTRYGVLHIASPFIYVPGLGPIPATGIYVLPAQFSASAPAPFDVYLQAVINSELSNLCEIHVE